MAYINENGYLERKTHAGKKNQHGKSSVRSWWLVKNNQNRGRISISKYYSIYLPKEMIGKRIKFKMEIIE